MKTLLILALLAIGLGGMWYKGHLQDITDLRPEEIGLPSAAQLPALPEVAIPQPRDLSKAIHEESRQANSSEFIVQDAKVKPMSLEEAAKTGEIRAWAHSHQAQEEKSEIDKLMNFLARGKYE